ncbi:MAG: oligoendopeptidase F [Candidatus Eisenbacteria bacterium]
MKILVKSAIVPFLALLFAIPVAAGEEADEVMYYGTRDEIPLQYRWNLDDIFPSVEMWNQAYERVENRIPEMEKYRGRLGESALTLAEGIAAMFDLLRVQGELQVYAGQYRDQDTKNAEANELYARMNGLSSRVSQAIAFVDPEITQIDEKKLEKFRKNERLKTYGHYLDNLIRQKPHIRSGEVEELLASMSLVARAPYEAYSNLTSADIQWPKIMVKGEEKTVSPALYYSFVSDQDRSVRKEAALALFQTYTDFANTFAATYGGSVQKDVFMARTRNFDTAIDAKMFEVNVPTEVIETLVSTVHENLELIHEYAALRKELLDLDEFHVYDLYVGLVSEADTKYGYDEAYDIALDFWKTTYGDEYYQVAKDAYDKRWVDVYAGEGKRGGAYSWGSYDSHPYLLLNWGGTLEDVFTLVHEMGHSIHTYLANRNQDFPNAEYSLFVAEVASVASEALFLDYMMNRVETDVERLNLLDIYMGNITGTFLRQIFFHEFELKAHTMAEAGEALTKESLGEVYAEMWKQYYGPDLVLDEEFHAGWARIPHFYRTYYVWVYATSFAAGEAIAARVREGETTAVGDYLAMLKLGGSVYPLEALGTAGVDMTDPAVIRTVMDRYGETLRQMSTMLRELKKS